MVQKGKLAAWALPFSQSALKRVDCEWHRMRGSVLKSGIVAHYGSEVSETCARYAAFDIGEKGNFPSSISAPFLEWGEIDFASYRKNA